MVILFRVWYNPALKVAKSIVGENITFSEIGFFPHETWPEIKSLIRITSHRVKISTGEVSEEIRYYISDAEKSAKILLTGTNLRSYS